MVEITPLAATIIGLALAVILFLIRYLFSKPKIPGKTYKEMCQWSYERILNVSTEDLMGIDRAKKVQLFNAVSEHINDKHKLEKLLTTSEYNAYEKEFEKLKKKAPNNLIELYEHLVQLYKDEHNRKLAAQKLAA